MISPQQDEAVISENTTSMTDMITSTPNSKILAYCAANFTGSTYFSIPIQSKNAKECP